MAGEAKLACEGDYKKCYAIHMPKCGAHRFLFTWPIFPILATIGGVQAMLSWPQKDKPIEEPTIKIRKLD